MKPKSQSCRFTSEQRIYLANMIQQKNASDAACKHVGANQECVLCNTRIGGMTSGHLFTMNTHQPGSS